MIAEFLPSFLGALIAQLLVQLFRDWLDSHIDYEDEENED